MTHDSATPKDSATPGNSATPKNSAQPSSGLKVVRGTPDEAELAALVAGVVAFAGAADADSDDPASPTSAWMDRIRTMRGRRVVGPLGRGPSAWRHSFR